MKYSISKLKKTAFTYAGYKDYRIVKKNEKKDPFKEPKLSFLQKIGIRSPPKVPLTKTSYEIYCGPIKKTDLSIMDLLPGLDANDLPADMKTIVENKWTPSPELTVFDHKSGQALSASEAVLMRKGRWMPQYFQNPMQSYDYIVYESLVKNTLLGPVMRTLMKFIMGTGFRPELELKIPSGCDDEDKKTIEDNEEIISRLLQVDRAVTERGATDGIDISFKTKMTNMIQNMLIFNRSCAVFVYDEKDPIKIDGTEFPKLPVNLVDFHPRDMGLVKISPDSHKMVALQINQISGFVSTDEMIYLWNSDYGAPIWNSKYYGGSMMMPMIDAARMIRQQISSIMPAISENMASGLYHIFVEPQGGTDVQKETEYKSITEATDMGTSNVFMISPDRVLYENVNFDPKIGELIEMFNMLVKYILALANVPQIGFYDEAAANHATAVEKIQLTISTVINPMREWIGGEIAMQWYNRIFKVLYASDEKLLDKFNIKVSFEDLQVETLKERAEGLEILEARAPLDNQKAEEILQVDGYAAAIDTEKEPVPPREQFQVEQENTKEKFKVDKMRGKPSAKK